MHHLFKSLPNFHGADDVQQLAYSGAVIAQCLNISRRQHSNLVRDGILPSPDAGKLYDMAPSVRAYLDFKLGSHGNLAEEKVRLVSEQRRKLEIANNTRESELIDAEHVEATLLQHTTIVVGHIKGRPGDIAITWHLSGVTFDDGGTASGSFVYDAATAWYSQVSITTTGSLAFTYTNLHSFFSLGFDVHTGTVPDSGDTSAAFGRRSRFRS
jgi:hypothetical protein